MGQAEDWILQVCQLREFKQTKEWERYPKPIPASLRDTPARKIGKVLSRMASKGAKQSQGSNFSMKKNSKAQVS